MRAWPLLLLAACGHVGFTDASREATAITIAGDNGYMLSLGTATSLGPPFVSVFGDGENQIADCPLGVGPKRWTLGGAGVLYIYAWDVGDARGVKAQLETPIGPMPLAALGLDACAGTYDSDPTQDPRPAAQTLFDQCTARTAAASGTWIDEGGTGMLDTGSWDGGYPTCPGVFVDATEWLWWTDGTFPALVSGTGPTSMLLRVTLTQP